MRLHERSHPTRQASVVVAVLALAACGKPVQVDPTDPTRCSPLVQAIPDEGRAHVPAGTPVVYQHNPPASGPHWSLPPNGDHPFGVFLDVVVPREWWVHNLEHGGVVLLYNCGLSDGGTCQALGYDDTCAGDLGVPPAGCPEVTDALRTLHDERAPDEFNEVRVLVTADPYAPRRVSAIAWDWLWESDSVDLAAMRCFRDARYGQGPEEAP
jgi:hypothetical protein